MDQTNLRQRIAGLIFPFLMTIFTLRFKRILDNFIRAKNLSMRSFAQFGGRHQRNILTLEQNWDYFVTLGAFTLADNALTIVFQVFRDQVNTNTRFFIQNFIWVLSFNCFFSMYVPLKHLILSKDKLSSLWLKEENVKPSPFYVRKQELIPRRYFAPIMRTKHHFSYMTTETTTRYCKPENIRMTQTYPGSPPSGTIFIKVDEYKNQYQTVKKVEKRVS